MGVRVLVDGIMTTMASSRVQFGCGLNVAQGWSNYDASPTLWLQRLPLVGALAKRLVPPTFPALARFGDVTRRLPHADGSVQLVYCSHVLEHLSLNDMRRALREVHRVLVPGGVFRGVLPDLAYELRAYLDDHSPYAAHDLLRRTALGLEERPRTARSQLRSWLGNSAHLWMWDEKGLLWELNEAGFEAVRRARIGDSSVPDFAPLEEPSRWHQCLGFEARKPL